MSGGRPTCGETAHCESGYASCGGEGAIRFVPTMTFAGAGGLELIGALCATPSFGVLGADGSAADGFDDDRFECEGLDVFMLMPFDGSATGLPAVGRDSGGRLPVAPPPVAMDAGPGRTGSAPTAGGWRAT